MQKIFFTSDTHFGHANIINYSNRPFKTIEEHDEVLINNINQMVGRRDFLYHLGDFCWGDTARKQIIIAKDILSKINCKNIYLIVGNHDPRGNGGQPNEDFAKLFKSCVNYHVVRVPLTDDQDAALAAPRHQIILSHYAIRTWEGQHKGTYHLYGHSHATMPYDNTLSFDVGVDAIATSIGLDDPQNYRPISSFEVVERLQDKEIVAADGHGSSS